MVKKNEKTVHAAHIKKRTKGTSNEISFSVLDAVKEMLDKDVGGQKNHGSLLGNIALFTLPKKRKEHISNPIKPKSLPLSDGSYISSGKAKSFASDSTFAFSFRKNFRTQSLEDRVVRRKMRRRISKITLLSMIVVTVIILLIMGGMYMYRILQYQQSNIEHLNESLLLIGQTDETIVSLNSLIANPFDKSKETDFDGMQEEIKTAQSTLTKADQTLRSASFDLYNSPEKEVANQTIIAINARQTLLKTGLELLAVMEQIKNAAVSVEDAWNKVIKADELARFAADLVLDTTDENVQLSKEKTNEAITLLNEAYTTLENVQRLCFDVDLDPLRVYIEKRIASLQFAAASDDALLARNKEEALVQNDAYNKADMEAATQAKSLPPDPSSIIYDSYECTTDNLQSAYAAAGSQAGTADAFIRDYLGMENK